ncbi:uncharacterized protein LOC124262201 isoform X3 [Haliotis rubra]|uniref:uncharacterized protein LOC124262201 isoform X3 n=1 Tax=Haliotis rubra TaxID=36100 RepID=UPI001EE57307|nr:uncharacterized protein LOC124262201 isoform X3 [Haliotis rubra]
MPRKKRKPKPPSRDSHLDNAPSSSPSTSQAQDGEGKITTVEIQMTAAEVPVETKLTFSMRNETVISVHVNDALPLTQLSLWNCTPSCFVELTTKLCKALCQFDNKSKRYYNAWLSKMENGNVQFVFGHDEKDEALNMAKNHEVVKDMIEDLFKQIDVEMTSIHLKIEIPAPTQIPTTRTSSRTQKIAGRSQDREQKPDNSAEQETAAMGDVTIKGVDGTGTANRSIVGGTQKVGKMIQVQGDFYEGSENSQMADPQKQITRSKGGKKTKEMHIQFNDEDSDETYNSTCKTEWTCKTKPNKQVLNVDPSSSVMEPLYEIKDSTRRTHHAKLKEVRSGSIVFVFEHETREDAIQMIKRHQEIEHLILHCLRQLDSEVEDITLHIKLQDLSEYERKVDTREPSPLKRKPIISYSISTGKDYLSADTSLTSSGEHMSHKKKGKLSDWPSFSRCQTCLQPIPHPQTSGLGEELLDRSNKQYQEIVRGLKQQITTLNIELGQKDEQIKDYERSQLAETRMLLWMRIKFAFLD